ncbi:MAG: hypothetical protein BMS9Abin06_0600 [Gammaproteobacteria bacterium]|nr:MAG: hypothetical protein BMS9Abin06_0600 [Gammaproteobacteria bacterium]
MLGKQPSLNVNIMVGEVMKAEYDFSKMKSRKNPRPFYLPLMSALYTLGRLDMVP